MEIFLRAKILIEQIFVIGLIKFKENGVMKLTHSRKIGADMKTNEIVYWD